MKLVIYSDTLKVNPTIILRLEHSIYGISLVVVDQEGVPLPGGCILDISEAGVIDFRSNVNPDLGFNLDSEGQVKHN